MGKQDLSEYGCPWLFPLAASSHQGLRINNPDRAGPNQ